MNYSETTLLVVEDLQAVRQELVTALNENPEFRVIGEAASVPDAFEKIVELRPRAIFLDIELEQGNAFHLLRKLRREKVSIPPIILNTAHREMELAQQAFNEFKESVVLLLLKPFFNEWDKKQEEILEAIEAHHDKLRLAKKHQQKNRPIAVRRGNVTQIIDPAELLFVTTAEKGSGQIEIQTVHEHFKVNYSLRQMLELLPASVIQISRNCAVNRSYISNFDHSTWEVHMKIGGHSFLVGKKFQHSLLSYFEDLKF